MDSGPWRALEQCRSVRTGRTGRDRRLQLHETARRAIRWPVRFRRRPAAAGWHATMSARIGVTLANWRIRRMKTRWGTCNREAGRIWLNSELAKKPVSCLEYVVVHEMVHRIERGHNERFRGIMDRVMPGWGARVEKLNRGGWRRRGGVEPRAAACQAISVVLHTTSKSSHVESQQPLRRAGIERWHKC